MTGLETTADRLTQAAGTPPVQDWLARAWATVSCWVARSRSRSVLATMNERMLRDIGLTRADVVMETRKHFWER